MDKMCSTCNGYYPETHGHFIVASKPPMTAERLLRERLVVLAAQRKERESRVISFSNSAVSAQQELDKTVAEYTSIEEALRKICD